MWAFLELFSTPQAPLVMGMGSVSAVVTAPCPISGSQGAGEHQLSEWLRTLTDV